MAHFAELNENNDVLRVIPVDDNDASDEAAGIAFCKNHLGEHTIWRQTSYNSRGGKHYNADNTNTLSGKPALRYNFAGIGSKYNPTLDAFYSPNPPNENTNWLFDEESQTWINNMKVVEI